MQSKPLEHRLSKSLIAIPNTYKKKELLQTPKLAEKQITSKTK